MLAVIQVLASSHEFQPSITWMQENNDATDEKIPFLMISNP